MFQNLKTKNPIESHYHNMPPPKGQSQGLRSFHSNPKSSTDATQTTAPIKRNEGDRLVRCRVCGFPCDKERDNQAATDSWAGFGIDQGSQLTAAASKLSDGRTLSATGGAQNADKYYSRTIVGGCPACGCWDYARGQ